MNFLRVVLVRPKYPRNIGLVSRAMDNFGLTKLILIAPQCELDEEAKQGAAQGQDPLSQVKIYGHWSDFLRKEVEGPRLAFSRRQGRRRPSQALNDAVKTDIFSGQRPTYLFFGAEDHGLNHEDLNHIHQVIHFDLPGNLQSMNLSHAVVLSLQTIFLSQTSQRKLPESITSEPITDPEPFLRQWLEALDFDLHTRTRWNALISLKQMIMKGAPTKDELHRLEMIIQQTLRRIRDK